MNWRAAKTVGTNLARKISASRRRSRRPIMWAPLREADHVRAAVALEARCFLVDAAELPLGNVAVIAAQLLLGFELHTVVGELALAPLAVLARAVFAPVYWALRPPPDVLAH